MIDKQENNSYCLMHILWQIIDILLTTYIMYLGKLASHNVHTITRVVPTETTSGWTQSIATNTLH